MNEDDEQTMQMAADIARNRRTVELRKRSTKVSTNDAFSQTQENEERTKDSGSMSLISSAHRQTTLLCYISFVLVISNLSQLRLTISLTQHRHFYVILGLLLTSLILQCSIALILAYVTKKDINAKSNSVDQSYTSKYHGLLLLFLSVITLVNIIVFILS